MKEGVTNGYEFRIVKRNGHYSICEVNYLRGAIFHIDEGEAINGYDLEDLRSHWIEVAEAFSMPVIDYDAVDWTRATEIKEHLHNSVELGEFEARADNTEEIFHPPVISQEQKEKMLAEEMAFSERYGDKHPLLAAMMIIKEESERQQAEEDVE